MDTSKDTGDLPRPVSRLERARQTTGFWLGPAVMLGLWLWPMPELSPPAHRLAGIMGLVMVFWLTEAIPLAMTALLGPVLCIVLGVAPAAEVLPNFGHPLILLFLGSFILARAMELHGVSRRLALGLLSWERVAASPRRVMFALGALTAALSMWISNTATAAIMFPIAVGLWRALTNPSNAGPPAAAPDARSADGRFGTGLMLLVAYAASIGGLATPVGSPPNLIALGALEKLAGVRLSFFAWMLFALPVAVVLLLILFLFLSVVCPPPAGSPARARGFVAAERHRLGGWTAGQRNTAVAFGVTVALWVLPGLAAAVWGRDSAVAVGLERHLPEPAAALVGALLLFILPVHWGERRFTLTPRQAWEIDWGTLLLFGGGLALGEQMFHTGLARAVGNGLVALTGARSLLALTLLAVGLAMVLTETTSNTASANMVVPIVIGLAVAAELGPVPPALGAALGASMGFLLPVSTPPNAIVYSSGLVPIPRMVTYGLAMSLAAFVVVSLAAYGWLPRVLH